MLEDTNWYLLFRFEFWGGVAAALLLWWFPTTLARRALGGSWRSWVMSPPIPFQISSRNTWPFMAAAAAVAMAIALLSLPLEVLNWEGARQGIWNLFFVPWVFVFLSFFWWPLGLSPAWYREWARSRGSRGTNPWPPAEAAAVRDAPPSKKRDRRLADVERCLSKEDRRP